MHGTSWWICSVVRHSGRTRGAEREARKERRKMGAGGRCFAFMRNWLVIPLPAALTVLGMDVGRLGIAFVISIQKKVVLRRKRLLSMQKSCIAKAIEK